MATMRMMISTGDVDTNVVEEIEELRRQLLAHANSIGDTGDVLQWLGVPERYSQRRLADFTDGGKKHVDAVLAIRSRLEGETDQHGIFFGGDARTGKTSLACAALRAALSKYSKTVFFITYDDLVDHIRQRVTISQNASNMDSVQEWMEEWYETTWRLGRVYEWLVVDDLGRTGAPDFMRDEIYALIRRRGDHGLVTILTTNLQPDQMETLLDVRMREYLRSEYEQILFGKTEKMK
jgi:DNA replication protein DnaC